MVPIFAMVSSQCLYRVNQIFSSGINSLVQSEQLSITLFIDAQTDK